MIVDVMAINQRDHDENVHCFKISHEKSAKIKNRIIRASRILPMADPHKHPIFSNKFRVQPINIRFTRDNVGKSMGKCDFVDH